MHSNTAQIVFFVMGILLVAEPSARRIRLPFSAVGRETDQDVNYGTHFTLFIPNEPIDLRYYTVLFWGGLRGAVTLALAFSIPTSWIVGGLFNPPLLA